MRGLGISAYYHDTAAAFVDDAQVAAEAQEERFTRKKSSPGTTRCGTRACSGDSRHEDSACPPGALAWP
jgi:carbamoyltransferase